MENSDPYIGKHLLVGLTYVDGEGNVVQQIQTHGVITKIDEEGIFIEQANGEEFSLPPDVVSLKVAVPGDYRLRSTGEVVENPDFICQWTIHSRGPSESEDR